MNQITGALTKKYGPLPGYAWAGIIAVAAFFVIPLLKGRASSSSSSTTTPPSSYSLPAPGGAPPAPSPTSTTFQLSIRGKGSKADAAAWDQRHPGVPLFASPGGATIDYLPFGSTLTSTGPAVSGPSNGGSTTWWPVSGGYVSGYDVAAAAGAAIGGALRRGAASIGNRRQTLMSAHHPDLKNPVRVTQTIAAVGGPANHVANIHAVAARTGVHPARLLALNPHHTGVIRIH